MAFPIDFSFKKIALAPQIYVRNAQGNIVAYVKQKLFKLKEDISVFSDESQSTQRFRIQADRIIDFSAKYTFTTANGQAVGGISRQGMRSIWRARYDIFGAQSQFVFQEENGWIKVLDAVVSGVPVLGMFAGYFLNPTYLIVRAGSNLPVARLRKMPAFWEGLFRLEAVGAATDAEQDAITLGCMTVLLLERSRG